MVLPTLPPTAMIGQGEALRVRQAAARAVKDSSTDGTAKTRPVGRSGGAEGGETFRFLQKSSDTRTPAAPLRSASRAKS